MADPSPAERALYARARRAYERGRRRRALPYALLAAPLAALAVAAGAPALPALALALALALLLFVLALAGRGVERALVPAVVTGALPLLAATLPLPHPCAGEACLSLCAPLCFTGGALAGGVAALRGGRHFLALAGVALVAGALACLPLGAGAALGLATGLAAGAVPLALGRRLAS